jgi:hypothetical protein
MSSSCEFDATYVPSVEIPLTFILVSNSGDSCHPMLPYLAQGANSAIEDGAVLGLLLGHLETKDQLPQALKMYERLRKSRGDAIARETFKQVNSRVFLVYCLQECSHYLSAEGVFPYARRSRTARSG